MGASDSNNGRTLQNTVEFGVQQSTRIKGNGWYIKNQSLQTSFQVRNGFMKQCAILAARLGTLLHFK